MKFNIKNLEETAKLAGIFASLVKDSGVFLCLYGDIGVGKTAFTKAFLKNIGVEGAVTSPSFVIMNEYKGSHLPVYHFDLYRLEKEGVSSIVEELAEYSKERVITFVEWADFGEYELPNERLDLIISYNFAEGETARTFEFRAQDSKYNEILEKLKAQF
jgi:tRNA threonylcarbamoyladenosine biosynthesis protein TsaE